MSRSGKMGGHAMNLCGISPLVRAYISAPGFRRTLAPHIVHIRKALATGKSCSDIGKELGFATTSIFNFAKRYNLSQQYRRSRAAKHYLCDAQFPKTKRSFYNYSPIKPAKKHY